MHRDVQRNIKTVDDLKAQLNAKTEHLSVVNACSKILSKAMDHDALFSNYDHSSGIYGSEAVPLVELANAGIGSSGLAGVNHICGVISTDREDSFRRMLFRAMRSNLVINTVPISQHDLQKQANNNHEQDSKSVYIIFLTSQAMFDKATRICEAHSNVYNCPRMSHAQLKQFHMNENLRATDIQRLVEVVRK